MSVSSFSAESISFESMSVASLDSWSVASLDSWSVDLASKEDTVASEDDCMIVVETVGRLEMKRGTIT